MQEEEAEKYNRSFKCIISVTGISQLMKKLDLNKGPGRKVWLHIITCNLHTERERSRERDFFCQVL